MSAPARPAVPFTTAPRARAELWRARLRRDVTLAAVHAGLRAAIGTVAPLALAYSTGVRAYVLAAVGGWLAAMADVGGAGRTRARTMGAYVVLGGCSYAAGALAAGEAARLRAGGEGWLAVVVVAALVFCWAAGCALFRALGDAGATLGTLVAVTFVAALANPAATGGAALVGGAMIAGGGAWTMLLALAVWPVRPYAAARHAAGDAYAALARYARAVAAADPPGAGPARERAARESVALAQAEHPRVRAAIEGGRSVLLATRRGRLGASSRADDLALLLDVADLAFSTLLTLAEAYEVALAAAGTAAAAPARAGDVATLGTVLGLAAAALDELALAVVPGARAGLRPPALAALGRALAAADAGGAAGGGDVVRHALALAEQLLEEIDRGAEMAASLASGGEDTLLAAVRGAVARWRRPSGRAPRRRAVARVERWRRAASAIDAAVGRHALRLGAAAAAAHALGAGLHIARGPWLTVTTLIVLQPSAGTTLRRSAARVGGTVAGGIVAALLAAALRDPRLIAATVFPLAAAAVALRAVHYGVFTFFLTPVFVLIAQPAPGDWGLAGVRAADTALGGAVAVAASLLLWPTWEAASLPGTLAAAVEAARAHAALAVRRAAGEGPPDEAPSEAAVVAARRRAGLAATAGEDALGRFIAEPGGRGPRAEATLALLARVRRVNAAAAAVAGFGAAGLGGAEPGPDARGASRLLALGADVDALLGEAAAAVRDGRAPAAVPAGAAALLGDPGPGGPSREIGATAERRLPEVPAWGALVRCARHALGVRAAAQRLADGGGAR